MLNKYSHIAMLFCLSVIYLATAPDEGPIPYQEAQPRHDIEMRTDNHHIIMGRDSQGDGQGDLVWGVPRAEPREKQENPPIIIRPEIYPQLPGQMHPGYMQPGTENPGGTPSYRPGQNSPGQNKPPQNRPDRNRPSPPRGSR